jgi:hypothetical protein
MANINLERGTSKTTVRRHKRRTPKGKTTVVRHKRTINKKNKTIKTIKPKKIPKELLHKELLVHIESSPKVFSQATSKVITDLSKRRSRGDYDRQYAINKWRTVVAKGVSDYNKTHDFKIKADKSDKDYVASQLRVYYEPELLKETNNLLSAQEIREAKDSSRRERELLDRERSQLSRFQERPQQPQQIIIQREGQTSRFHKEPDNRLARHQEEVPIGTNVEAIKNKIKEGVSSLEKKPLSRRISEGYHHLLDMTFTRDEQQKIGSRLKDYGQRTKGALESAGSKVRSFWNRIRK